jgi:organic radical activating enzyme
VVIFGTGEIGQLTHYALTRADVQVDAFCDPIARNHGSTRRGSPVISLDQLAGFASDSHIFDCGDYRLYGRRAVTSFLDRFTNIELSADLLTDTDLSEADVDIARPELRRRVALYISECRYATREWAAALRLKTLDVVVTEACSMRCQDCANLMQYYTNPKTSDLHTLLPSIDKVLASTDGVDEFRVLGGEPFMHREIYRVIEHLVAVRDSSRVVIYTNGTIVPRGPNLSCLKHDKVMVDITNYGPHSRNHDTLVAALKENGIVHVSKRPTWTDSGRIGFIERSEDELARTFRHCAVSDVVTLLNGKLYLCPFSANAMNLGAVPTAPDDVVDLTFDESPNVLRERIERLYKRRSPLVSCSYCKGRDYTSPIIEAGIQTRRPLPLPVLSAQA